MSFHECYEYISTLFHNEGSCRVIYAFNQLFWIFGSLYIAIGSIGVYSRSVNVDTATSSAFLGILAILGTIFTVSNSLHICLQLPTSTGSLKLQKVGHFIMLLCYAGGLCCYSILSSGDDQTRDKNNLLIQCSIIYVLLLVTSISCIYV